MNLLSLQKQNRRGNPDFRTLNGLSAYFLSETDRSATQQKAEWDRPRRRPSRPIHPCGRKIDLRHGLKTAIDRSDQS